MPFDIFPKIEIDFFNAIKEDLEVIFDIGSRDDIDYLKNSYDKSREFHLFEPDPKFLMSCQKQIEELDPSEEIENSIYLIDITKLTKNDREEIEYLLSKKGISEDKIQALKSWYSIRNMI